MAPVLLVEYNYYSIILPPNSRSSSTRMMASFVIDILVADFWAVLATKKLVYLGYGWIIIT